MSYFKFNSAEALAAWDEMERQERELKTQSEAFAALFGGKPVFQKTACDWRFHGVRFDEHVYISEALWTKQSQRNGWSRTPLVKVPASMKQESQKLRELWDARRPTAVAERDGVYTAIGLDWGDLIFCGIEMFRLGDEIYVQTGATPKPEAGGIEILGSAYTEAKAAFKADKAGS